MYIAGSVSWIGLCVVCFKVDISLTVGLTTIYVTHPSKVGVGTILQNLPDVSVLSCGIACSREERCDAATYFPGNQTCSLLQHGVMNTEETPEGLYLGQSSEVGLWTFIGKTSNSFEPLGSTEESGITYEPADASDEASPRVLTFHSNINSYLVLTNTGSLTLTSFTWTARIFPTKVSGPLWAWTSDDLVDDLWGTHIFLFSDGALFLRVCHDGGVPGSGRALSSNAVDQNAWNTVAVSYDAHNGAVQLYVNGVVSSSTVTLIGEHATYGDVVMGSRYHHSDSGDTRSFGGNIVCIRLWAEARDWRPCFSPNHSAMAYKDSVTVSCDVIGSKTNIV